MNLPSSSCREHVFEVVARCLEGGQSPGDVLARMPALRGTSPSLRAEVVHWARHVLGARLRLEHALGGALPPRAADRARALTAAAMIEAGVSAGPWSDGTPTREQLRVAVDDVADPLERLAVRSAVPVWMAARFQRAYGDAAGAVLAGLGERPPRTLRCNALVGDRAAMRDALGREGVQTSPGKWAQTAVHCMNDADFFATAAYREGWFEQQDEASQLAAEVVAPPPRGRVLDLCAGSGGKSLALAAALQNRGVVMAADVHAGRVGELRGRLPRARADNVQPHLITRADDAELAAFAARSDRILVDAPCSGTGSWRRRPQARTNVTAADLEEMLRTQRELLARAAAWLQPGARLVYATCSLLPDENEQQVEWLLESRPELQRMRLAEILGSDVAAPISDATGTYLKLRPDLHGCDGFFLAVLRRPR